MKNRLGQIPDQAPTGTAASWAGVISAARKGTISGIRIGFAGRAPAAALVALALTGCATQQTRYVSTYCLTRTQFNQLKDAEPGKIKSQLNGDASHDVGPLAGSAIRLRSWGEGLLTVLDGCVDPNTGASAK
jgi:hypothetical protein